MKITLLNNNISDISTLTNGVQYLQSYANRCGIVLDITIKNINQKFTGTSFKNNAVGSGICVIPEQILANVDGSEDVAFLIYDWTTVSPQPTNPTQNPIKKGRCTPCQMPIQWYNTYPEVFAMYFAHELCHAAYYLNDKVSQDLTHLFNNRNLNSALYDQWSNKQPIEYYMSILKSFDVPRVTLTRNSDDTLETLGELSYGSFSCKTLERPWKNNQSNISCIPKGIYNVKWTFSPRMLKYTYEIQNVQGRSGIRIHPANFWSQLLGCISLGTGYQDINSDKELDIINSKITTQAFETLMDKKNFTLIIK